MVLPSGRRRTQLVGGSVPSPNGFALGALASFFRALDPDHDFVVVTPDGEPPQLDASSLALPRSIELRRRRAELQRNRDVRTISAHLGWFSVSDLSDDADRETASYASQLLETVAPSLERPFFSIESLLDTEGVPRSWFALADMSVAHFAGGFGLNSEYGDDPEVGELLNRLVENRVVISFGSGSVAALASARHRINAAGWVQTSTPDWLSGTAVTVESAKLEASTIRRRIGMASATPQGSTETRLRTAGLLVRRGISPFGDVRWDASRRVLTAVGKRAGARHARRLRRLLDGSPASFG